jgi:hypothetical protein
MDDDIKRKEALAQRKMIKWFDRLTTLGEALHHLGAGRSEESKNFNKL